MSTHYRQLTQAQRYQLGLGVYGLLRKVCEQGLRGEAITIRSA